MQRRKSVFAPDQVCVDDLPPASEIIDAARLPDEELTRGGVRAVLHQVITELPPTYRSVVVLRDLEQLSAEETAQILDLTTDTGQDATPPCVRRHTPEAPLLPGKPLHRPRADSHPVSAQRTCLERTACGLAAGR
jgi:hypothetical protein